MYLQMRDEQHDEPRASYLVCACGLTVSLNGTAFCMRGEDQHFKGKVPHNFTECVVVC